MNGTIDLPLETMFVDASYKNKIITLTLQNGQTLDVNIGDIVNGLVTEDNFNNTINGLNLEINNLKTTIENQNGNIESQKTEIENLKTKTTNLENEDKNIKEQVNGVKTTVQNLDDKVTGLETNVNDFKDKVNPALQNLEHDKFGVVRYPIASDKVSQLDATDIISNYANYERSNN